VIYVKSVLYTNVKSIFCSSVGIYRIGQKMCYMATVSLKDATVLLPVPLPNADGFLKFFHR